MSALESKNSVAPKNIIGVFDSGLGGLTVLKYFLRDLPSYNYIYLGDNARVPYGEKSAETIYEYTREAMEYLFRAGCNLIIIACNTASAQALPRLQQEYLPTAYPDRRILGVIRPLAEEAASRDQWQRIGVIGTKSTINSRAYELEIKKINPSAEIIASAAPLLVPLIEEGWGRKPETKMILKKYLHPLKMKEIDGLILGCTHYDFLYPEIKKIMGRRIGLPRPGEIIAARLQDYLTRHSELGLRPVAEPGYHYRTTDSPVLFQELGEKFLGQKINNLKQAQVSEL